MCEREANKQPKKKRVELRIVECGVFAAWKVDFIENLSLAKKKHVQKSALPFLCMCANCAFGAAIKI